VVYHSADTKILEVQGAKPPLSSGFILLLVNVDKAKIAVIDKIIAIC